MAPDDEPEEGPEPLDNEDRRALAVDRIFDEWKDEEACRE